METSKIQDSLRELYLSAKDRVFVRHDPMSRRYSRAERALKSVVNQARALDSKLMSETPENQLFKLSVFLEPGNVDRLNGIPGKYAAFKIEFERDGQSWRATEAVLFAFYDNDPNESDKGNHGFLRIEDAKAFSEKKLKEDV